MTMFSPLTSAAGTCSKFEKIEFTNFSLSLLILLGIIISYAPQHYRIVARRSSEGISPFFVLLGVTSGTCMYNAILIQSRTEIGCCRQLSLFKCFSATLGTTQSSAQWNSFIIILVLYLIFFPRATALEDPTEVTDPVARPGWRTAIGVGLICVHHAVITFVLSAVFVFYKPSLVSGWTKFLGIQGAILAIIQYFPQIWTTYRLKHVGSLSITTMLIQSPGSFAWAGSLIARYGKAGWATWVPLMVSGLLQGSLLLMAIRYEYQARHAAKASPAANGANGNTHAVGRTETDDEGGHNVEGDEDTLAGHTSDEARPTERSPLLNKRSRP